MVAFVAALLVLGESHVSVTATSEGKAVDAVKDGQALLARANSARAQAWAGLFPEVDGDTADALARWAGLETGGNPVAVSRLGERGLIQIMDKSRKGIFDDAEWAALSDKATSAEDHARLAVKEYRALLSRAMAKVTDPPADSSGQVFFAKLWHQWPKDFSDIKMHGPALAMAAELAQRWKDAPNSLHRLRAASVVAWNNPEAWRTSANV